MVDEKGKTGMFNRKSIGVVAILVVMATLAVILLKSANCCVASPASIVQNISPVEYQDRFTSASHLLIDVRTPEEFASGHIQGAVNIPVDDLTGRLNEVPNNQPVVVYCRSGNRSARASQMLAQSGYTSIYDLGGITAWAEQGFPVE